MYPKYIKKNKAGFFIALTIYLTSISNVQAQETYLNNVLAQSGQVQTNKQSQGLLPTQRKANLPENRVGIDPSKVLSISLNDAIKQALEHNLDIQIEADNIKIAEHNLEAAQGVYDTTVDAKYAYLLDSFPFSISLTSNPSQFILKSTTSSSTYNGRISQSFASGGFFQVDFITNKFSTNNAFVTLSRSDQYRSVTSISFTQPFLKNFRINQNQRNIRSLKKLLDVSDLTFRRKLIDLVAQVQAAYYDLAFAIQNEQILRESVELAVTQLHRNEVQLEAGRAAPIDIVSSEAELELRRDEAIASLLAITQAENVLRNLILDDPTSQIWRSRILPVDPIDFIPETIDLQNAINIAMQRRPEIKELELRGELNNIEIEYFKNQLKPQLDFFASFSGVNLVGNTDTNQAPNTFIGNFEGLSGIFKFRGYSVGANFSFFIGNRTAKANFAKTLVDGRQIDARKRKMVQSILSEVYDSVAAVDATAERVKAATAAVTAATEQLKAEEEKYSVGLSNNFFVLQRQNNLSLARGRQLRAKVDYIKARASLQRVMANNIP